MRLALAAKTLLQPFLGISTHCGITLSFILLVSTAFSRGTPQPAVSHQPDHTRENDSPLEFLFTTTPLLAANRPEKTAKQSIPDSVFLTEPFPEGVTKADTDLELPILPNQPQLPEPPSRESKTSQALFDTSPSNFLFEPLYSTKPPTDRSPGADYDLLATASPIPKAIPTNWQQHPQTYLFSQTAIIDARPSTLSLASSNAPLQEPFPAYSSFESGLADLTRISDPSKNSNRTPALLYSFQIHSAATYDSNPGLVSSNPKADYQLSIGPVAQVSIGNSETPLSLNAGYAAFSSRFLKHPDPFSIDQRGFLEAVWNTGKSRVNLHSGINTSYAGTRDSGKRDTQSSFAAGASFFYQASEKFSTDLSADISRTGFETLLSSSEIRGQAFLNYELSPKTQISGGAGTGVLKADSGPTQTYNQALVRFITRPREKLFITATGGIELRDFSGQSDSTTSPVFSLAGSWQPTAKTTLNLQTQLRRFASASLQQQDYASSSISLRATTQLTPSLYSVLSGGYEHASYSATSSSINASRIDHFYTARAELLWAFQRWCDLGLFVERTTNSSTGTKNYSFQRERIGLSLSLRF
ncbi:MAG: outer membrane beta-barrel protein [Verrucomicrobiota bacterium]